MSEIFRMPQPGEGWRHYKGALYWITGVATDAATGNAIVVYRENSYQSRLFTRDLSVFLGFTEAHEQRFAFERCASEPTT